MRLRSAGTGCHRSLSPNQSDRAVTSNRAVFPCVMSVKEALGLQRKAATNVQTLELTRFANSRVFASSSLRVWARKIEIYLSA